MKGIFFIDKSDLLSAEVQAFYGDGAASLHTRNIKYGKVSYIDISYETDHWWLCLPLSLKDQSHIL